MKTPKIGFVSLGCPKALVDSERILTQLKLDGYDIVNSYDNADVVVVNTCGFINAAKDESFDTIGEAMNENGKVIVTGCLGVHEQEIRQRFPDVLNVSGPQQYESVVGAVHEHAPIKHTHDPYTDLLPPQGIKLTPRHYAYLKISEGCNHKCSFCIIPAMRGKLVSRRIDDVLREAENLVNAGVRELLVISQDTSAYGTDIKYSSASWMQREWKTDLVDLSRALGELGIWIRLHYVYPYPHVDNIIPLMADNRILPYLDIPFQHGSPAILKSMRRPAAAEDTLQRIKTWREICPELVIRSTFIVGFPGESEQDFQTLLEFLDEAQLDRVGCFEYSAVDGARANNLPNPVADDIKRERRELLMQHQQQISFNKLQRRIGQTMMIMVDQVEPDLISGRSYADAPEIDGIVKLAPEKNIQPGDLVEAMIDDADEYDLSAHIA